MNSFKQTFLLCFLLTLLSGCANWSPTVDTNFQPGENEAYLYGRFKIEAEKGVFGFYSTVGQLFRCNDGSEYIVRFTMDEPLQVIKVKPAICSLQEIVYTDSDSRILERKQAPGNFLKGVWFKEGNAYYVGDFEAKSKVEVFMRTRYWSWEITSSINNYLNTTNEMKKTYKHLTGVTTVDKAHAF